MERTGVKKMDAGSRIRCEEKCPAEAGHCIYRDAAPTAEPRVVMRRR